MKRKIFTLVFCAFLSTIAVAQDAPTGVVKKAPLSPVIDGYVDEVWAGANSYNIDLPFGSETPTLGNPGETTWRALWSDEGIFVLLQVTDNVYSPSYAGTDPGQTWMYDKPEVYFDCNAEKQDGLGAQTDGMGNGNGHYQFAPTFVEANIGGGVSGGTDSQAHGAPYAYHVVGLNYVFEYFIPFSILKDGTGTEVDRKAPIGFDVTVIDNDIQTPARNRAVWANIGSKNESWVNMDDCGTITLSDEEAIAGAIINKATIAPEIDGKIDDVWESANTYNINKPFYRHGTTAPWPAFEEPTLGESTWKALWDDAGMFILLQVDDDHWYPNWVHGGGDDYMYDKPELYFDTNVPRVDGKGGQANTKGSIQIAPGSAEGKIDGAMQTGTQGATGTEYNYAYLVSDPTYVVEYFIPWEAFTDKDDKAFDKMTSMGFDVTLIDQDPGTTDRARAVWMNDGQGETGNESWNNMDAAGVITFYGAAEMISVDDITVIGGSITTDNGTLQMVAEVSPDDATNQKVKWVVENGTGEATISKDGLLKALTNGTVLVKAMAVDGSEVEGKVSVTISGQVIDQNDIWNNLNLISFWNFNDGKSGDWPKGWGGWVDTSARLVKSVDPATKDTVWWDPSGLSGQIVPAIEDGVVVMQVGLAADNNNWHYQLNQSNLTAEAEIPYTLKFKSWGTADNTPCVVDFESGSSITTANGGDQYARYGSSSDAEALNGSSEWHYNVNIEPTWFTFHVIFDKMIETTVQKIQWMNSLSSEKIYLDSVLLIKDANLASYAPTFANSKSKVQLYPNPVKTELTISKIAIANSKVSVYNALGQKLMEKTAKGTETKFNVANLRKGMYFVRFSDGTSEKFTKQ